MILSLSPSLLWGFHRSPPGLNLLVVRPLPGSRLTVRCPRLRVGPSVLLFFSRISSPSMGRPDQPLLMTLNGLFFCVRSDRPASALCVLTDCQDVLIPPFTFVSAKRSLFWNRLAFLLLAKIFLPPPPQTTPPPPPRRLVRETILFYLNSVFPPCSPPSSPPFLSPFDSRGGLSCPPSFVLQREEREEPFPPGTLRLLPDFPLFTVLLRESEPLPNGFAPPLFFFCLRFLSPFQSAL